MSPPTPTERVVVGIDLGTTYSLVAVLRDGAPTLLPNALGELLTPSAVSLDDGGEWLVGAAARARAITHPELSARTFKRDMGTQRRFRLGRHELSATELSAMVLAELKRDAEAALGRAIDEAVVTVPAYFGDAQREATRQAATIAGLKVDRIVNEPTAAALAYGLHRLDTEQRVCVLDLGGGTFDVTLLTIVDGVVEIQASAGDARLGGEDFTEALARWAEEQILAAHGVGPADATQRARVFEAAETAKKALAALGSERGEVTLAVADLELAGARRRVDVKLSLRSEDALAAWKPLVERLNAPVIRVLRDARVLPTAVDEVLLVGGSARLPLLAELAERVFRRAPSHALPPDEAIALGAAVQAGLQAGDAAVEDLVVTDVAPFSMGVATGERMGASFVRGLFSPVLERGTTIPASRTRSFCTMSPYQTEVLIEVFQGEHPLVADNELLGSFRVTGLPRSEQPVEFDVRFTYDLNGILEVEALTDGVRRGELVVERRPGTLSKADVAAARETMRRLKVHPRELLPNRTAKARAEALFVELRGPEREVLKEHFDRFLIAQESQDPQLIERARVALDTCVAALKQRRR